MGVTTDPTNYARYLATLRKSSRIQTRGGRILLVRRGDLNPKDQTVGRYANRAPERRGFWAFPHPWFDECSAADAHKWSTTDQSAATPPRSACSRPSTFLSGELPGSLMGAPRDALMRQV